MQKHDIFFGIAKELRDLIPNIKAFWKGSGKIHIDGWIEVNNVDGYQITIVEKKQHTNTDATNEHRHYPENHRS